MTPDEVRAQPETTQIAAPASAKAARPAAKLVKQFRQILVWPLQLVGTGGRLQIKKHWECLATPAADNPWAEVADEITGDPKLFAERHYREFVAFLPYVQRFLYGEKAGGAEGGYADAPMRVFRRRDVAALRVTFAGHAEPVVFAVAHIDLYFFYDMDVVTLVCELSAENIGLDLAQEALYRLGRAYPGGWTENGEGLHCPQRVEFLAPDGSVLTASDYRSREKFLSAVVEHRAASLSAHWEYLLKPLVQEHSREEGPLRFRLIEYYKMPVMAYLGMDRMRELTRADYVRLGLLSGTGDSAALPFSPKFLADFESRYCYDRYFDEARGEWADVRFICSGYAFVTVGDAHARAFADAERGVLAQFRHEYFLLFQIAHLHKAALLMLSHRAVDAVARLNIESDDSVRRFRRDTRQSKEIFLRFTHRYWFHEVSDKVQTRELFHMLERHLGTERLYAEVREEIQDMANYLDSDALRRQSNTMIRLTVVTILGLILAAATGFLGMNIISEADAGYAMKIVYFFGTVLGFIALVTYTLLISRRLSEFLDVLTDDRLPGRKKWRAFLRVWRKR